MNARFAETCRTNPLDFSDAEFPIYLSNFKDGRSDKDLLLKCEQDIYIGVFFDGTNNNKYRDTTSFSQSNVARLYEVYPGTPAAQKPPKFKPRILPNGSAQERPVTPDVPFKPSSVPADEFPYYRKMYIPGVGTPMPDVKDSGTGMARTGGLVAATLGQVRLNWAMLQLINQVHAAVFRTPLEAALDIGTIWKRQSSLATASSTHLASLPPIIGWSVGQMERARAAINAQLLEVEKEVGIFNSAAYEASLSDFEARLTTALTKRGTTKPHLRKIRLSVFGFSRGSAAARAWVNLINNRWGSALAGVALQIDFLGIFDTVASVGLAQSTPHFDGHAAWAGDGFLEVPGAVKRCAHLVAALEIRGSFPLDSVCQGESLPSNCKEIVYPGVHSDVGGGYPPDDQGRARGGPAGDPLKISQISLAQMYREARMAGVPLAPKDNMLPDQKLMFAIAPALRRDFNAYIDATRSGSIPPTLGKGDPVFARMYPTETQPREELFRLMRRHTGFSLRWRREMLRRPGGIAALPGLINGTGDSHFQDIEDFRSAEVELHKELLFLQSTDPHKFDRLDDPLDDPLGKYLNNYPLISALASRVALAGAYAVVGGPLCYLLSVVASRSMVEVMRDKQKQWDTWLKDEWHDQDANAITGAAEQLFANYVHDSRAWFKPLLTDGGSLAPNDEDWFVYGDRQKERAARINKLNRSYQKHLAAGDKQAADADKNAILDLMLKGPLIEGGREPYRMWGYVRHRRIYQSGKLKESDNARRNKIIQHEESDRQSQQRRQDRIAAENARHDAEVKRINDDSRRVVQEHRLSSEQEREYLRIARSQIAHEGSEHAEVLRKIDAKTGETVQ